MNIKAAEQNPAAEPTLPLASVQSGEAFRFAHDSFEEALKADLIFMRVEAPELKDAVKIVNLKDGKMLVRDGIHRVVKHEVCLRVRP